MLKMKEILVPQQVKHNNTAMMVPQEVKQQVPIPTELPGFFKSTSTEHGSAIQNGQDVVQPVTSVVSPGPEKESVKQPSPEQEKSTKEDEKIQDKKSDDDSDFDFESSEDDEVPNKLAQSLLMNQE